MAHLWIVLYTKSISYVRGFTSEIYHFFQYRKRISTAYRDSLVPSNEDICILSFHISRFITFSFSKRISHRYAVLFPRIFFFFIHFLLFPLFLGGRGDFLFFSQTYVKLFDAITLTSYEELMETISILLILFIALENR